jgi:hypothetical protein
MKKIVIKVPEGLKKILNSAAFCVALSVALVSLLTQIESFSELFISCVFGVIVVIVINFVADHSVVEDGRKNSGEKPD